jgi:caspase 6
LDVVDHKTDKLDNNVTEVDAASVYTLPAGADFLMCYSVAEGEGERGSDRPVIGAPG